MGISHISVIHAYTQIQIGWWGVCSVMKRNNIVKFFSKPRKSEKAIEAEKKIKVDLEPFRRDVELDTKQNHFMYDENASDTEENQNKNNSASSKPITPNTITVQMEDMQVDESSNSTNDAHTTLSPGSSNNVPLQRLVNSVRRPRGPPSLKKSEQQSLLNQGWLVHYTSQTEARHRHYWRLTTRCVTLFSDENKEKNQSKTVIQLNEILRVEQGIQPGSRTPVLKLVMSNQVYSIIEDTSVSQQGNSTDKWYKAFKEALSPHLVTSTSGNRMALEKPPSNASMVTDNNGKKDATRSNSFHWSRDANDQTANTIQDIYQIFTDEILGSGQFGTVYSAKHRKKGFDVAIKCVDKKRFPQKENQQLRHEVTVLSGLDHAGIVKIYNMFETVDQVFVVMEKLHSDMLELILSSEKGKLENSMSKFLIYQVLVALQYLHKRCIVHCDLKPENVLILQGTGHTMIKLCDFGFARIIGEKSFRTSVVGTPAYLAPEVLRNEGYNRSLDMWSVGVIIYVTLSGTFPFNEDEDINDQIENAEFMFPTAHWSEVDPDAIALIKRLLQVKRRRRLSVDKALSQKWLNDYDLWCTLRQVEQRCGYRYLTHESDDERWANYANQLKLNSTSSKL